VFANAESLFYYAKQGRPNRRTLSQAEIQALLKLARVQSIDLDSSSAVQDDKLEASFASSFSQSVSESFNSLSLSNTTGENGSFGFNSRASFSPSSEVVSTDGDTMATELEVESATNTANTVEENQEDEMVFNSNLVFSLYCEWLIYD